MPFIWLFHFYILVILVQHIGIQKVVFLRKQSGTVIMVKGSWYFSGLIKEKFSAQMLNLTVFFSLKKRKRKSIFHIKEFGFVGINDGSIGHRILWFGPSPIGFFA